MSFKKVLVSLSIIMLIYSVSFSQVSNQAAGAVAANSYWPGFMIDYGFGVYNMSENNASRSIGNIGSDIKNTPIGTVTSIFSRAKFGESRLSQKGIDAGKAYMQKILSKKGGAGAYFKSF